MIKESSPASFAKQALLLSHISSSNSNFSKYLLIYCSDSLLPMIFPVIYFLISSGINSLDLLVKIPILTPLLFNSSSKIVAVGLTISTPPLQSQKHSHLTSHQYQNKHF
jgi:hypothetical protein